MDHERNTQHMRGKSNRQTHKPALGKYHVGSPHDKFSETLEKSDNHLYSIDKIRPDDRTKFKQLLPQREVMVATELATNELVDANRFIEMPNDTTRLRTKFLITPKANFRVRISLFNFA